MVNTEEEGKGNNDFHMLISMGRFLDVGCYDLKKTFLISVDHSLHLEEGEEKDGTCLGEIAFIIFNPYHTRSKNDPSILVWGGNMRYSNHVTKNTK